MNIQISRRDALLGSGALIVSFALAGSSIGAQAQGATKPLALTEVDSFLAIDKTGKVTVYSGKVDLGTGITTALRQIVADELDVPIGRIELITGRHACLRPTRARPGASLTIQLGGMQLRQAAAAARQALLAEAAKKLGTDKLTVTDGVVSGGAQEGQLRRTDRRQELLDQARPKAAGEGKIAEGLQDRRQAGAAGRHPRQGHRPLHLHAGLPACPACCTGAWCGRPRSAPSSKESTNPRSRRSRASSGSCARANFLGVVATNEWDAIRGADALKATWSKSETLPDQAKLWEHVRATKVAKEEEYGKTGNTAEAMAKDGVKIIKATYDFAIHTHGSIGPSCAVAEFKDGMLTSWSASQATHDLRKQLAQMFSLPPEKVRCIYVEGSGCYGRNGHEDAAADAALAGQSGRQSGARAMVARRRARLGPERSTDADGHAREHWMPQGNVTAWEGDFYMPQQTPGGFLVPLVAATLVRHAGRGPHRPRATCSRTRRSGYKFPNTKVRLQAAGDDAVPPVLDQDAGADAEHLRQ